MSDDTLECDTCERQVERSDSDCCTTNSRFDRVASCGRSGNGMPLGHRCHSYPLRGCDSTGLNHVVGMEVPTNP